MPPSLFQSMHGRRSCNPSELANAINAYARTIVWSPELFRDSRGACAERQRKLLCPVFHECGQFFCEGEGASHDGCTLGTSPSVSHLCSQTASPIILQSALGHTPKVGIQGLVVCWTCLLQSCVRETRTGPKTDWRSCRAKELVILISAYAMHGASVLKAID